MSSISVASKNCRNKAVAQKTLRIRLKKLQKSLKTLINSTFLACHLFRSPNTKNRRTPKGVLLFFLCDICDRTPHTSLGTWRFASCQIKISLIFIAKQGSESLCPSQKKNEAIASFFFYPIRRIGMESHRRWVCNRRRRMASRDSVYFSFGLIPYITSWWFHSLLRRDSMPTAADFIHAFGVIGTRNRPPKFPICRWFSDKNVLW